MEEWIVTISVQVIAPRGSSEADAKALVQPYADAMGVTGVSVDSAVRVHSSQYLTDRDNRNEH